jgi:hypothetical protein
MSKYILDTSILINAHQSLYPLNVAKSFWQTIQDLAESETIISIDKVKFEIFRNEDQLEEWCRACLPVGFWKPCGGCLDEYQRIIQWANRRSDHYKESALSTFMNTDNADPWLIAYAMKEGGTIVTNEVSAPESKKNIKIPDACKPFGVECLSLMEVFVKLNVTF